MGYYRIDSENPPSIREVHRRWMAGDKAYDGDLRLPSGMAYHAMYPIDEVMALPRYAEARHQSDPPVVAEFRAEFVDRGWVDPMRVVVGRRGGIVSGGSDYRLDVAKELGVSRVPVWFLFYQEAPIGYTRRPTVDYQNAEEWVSIQFAEGGPSVFLQWIGENNGLELKLYFFPIDETCCVSVRCMIDRKRPTSSSYFLESFSTLVTANFDGYVPNDIQSAIGWPATDREDIEYAIRHMLPEAVRMMRDLLDRNRR